MGGSMTLINGAPGAARPGEDGGRSTPQSGIPTQGGPGTWPPRPSGPFVAPLSAPPGSVPPPRPIAPPFGAPAQRSPLVVGSGSRPGSVDDRTSLVSRSEPSVADRWKKALALLRQRGPARWGLLGFLAVVQTFLLFSAVMWWLGSGSPTATASMAPQTWTGIVYDVGAAGVNMRSAPQVRPDDARDTAARGARLALKCGETGDVVAKGSTTTATWVQTTDGLWVSMLYVRVPDRQSIPSCNGSKVDGPLLALADPAHPGAPPPPGMGLAGQEGQGDAGDFGNSNPVSSQHTRREDGLPESPGPVTLAAPPGPGAPVAPPANAPAAPPATKLTVGTGVGTKTTPTPKPAPMPAPTLTTGPRAAHSAPNPDTTPVG